MTQTILVSSLCELNDFNWKDFQGDYEEIFKFKIEKARKDLSLDYDNFLKDISQIFPLNFSSNLYEWKFICLNFYILHLIDLELSKSDDIIILSVQEIKKVKSSLKKFLQIGICKNLQKKLPHFIKINTNSDVLFNYNAFKSTINSLICSINSLNLRMIILPDCLQEILVALHQIAFCQLKKPTRNCSLSEETYTELVNDQKIFRKSLEDLRKSIHSTIFVKETMLLLQTNSPLWFKKSVSNTLTSIIRSDKGIENISSTLLNTVDDDRTKTWKILEILTKLILSCKKFADFEENICRHQLINLLDSVKSNNNLLIFERLFVSCTKMLYLEDKNLCEKLFIKRIIKNFDFFLIGSNYEFDSNSHNLTEDIKQTIRLIYGIFIDNIINLPCLPKETFKSVINVVFQFYSLTVKTTFLQINKELKEILIKYLKHCNFNEITELFDSFIFAFENPNFLQFRNDILITIEKANIQVKISNLKINYATSEAADNLMKLAVTEHKLLLFGYLLKCITNKEKYFKIDSNSLLLNLEDNPNNYHPVIEKLLITQKLLSELVEDKSVQEAIKKNPDNIIQYFQNILENYHQTVNKNEEDNSDYQMLFIVLMILENLIQNCTKLNLIKYKILTKSLEKLGKLQTTNNELKCFCLRLQERLLCKEFVNNTKINENIKQEVSELDKAIDDISDPLLPVRGHGLMVLAKLIRNKDKKAIERKQYILNIFQLALKNEDSYIYLNGIEGLAVMADIFPTTVLNILCEEYSDFSKKNADDGYEFRIKLGEVLVRVTKLLGEMAPKYKSLLLNTFLITTKDDDHLIRASSLSNLGEICKVLGYKLGSIYTEILDCVHAIITTDKAIEARRAAVTVIRQLFVGLESEMIAFLKDDILPIYRTLKQIYYHDNDDVMRLQAQLALEELNENMKNLVFPKTELNYQKKIVMLD